MTESRVYQCDDDCTDMTLDAPVYHDPFTIIMRSIGKTYAELVTAKLEGRDNLRTALIEIAEELGCPRK